MELYLCLKLSQPNLRAHQTVIITTCFQIVIILISKWPDWICFEAGTLATALLQTRSTSYSLMDTKSSRYNSSQKQWYRNQAKMPYILKWNRVLIYMLLS